MRLVQQFPEWRHIAVATHFVGMSPRGNVKRLGAHVWVREGLVSAQGTFASVMTRYEAEFGSLWGYCRRPL